MDTFAEIEKILVDILDLENREMTPDTYLILDLGAESIDLLELAVAINSRFKITVKDDDLFLTRFRSFMIAAQEQKTDVIPYIVQRYPFLTEDRLSEIAARITEGPQLKIQDLVNYITFQSKKS
jgi:acyl carrier protein